MVKQTLCLIVFGALSLTRPLFAAPEIEFDEPAPWKESQQALPSYPQDADLLEFKVDGPGSAFEYRIDSKSLLLAGDSVVHYTVVLTSRTGTTNVLREGLRCATNQYKTYGYGTPELTLAALERSEWRKIESQGPARFRRDLLNYYLCDSLRIPLQPVQILKRLQHPPDFSSTPNPGF
ncbi:MAG: CNP1-like family protein [Gammaproteobacteria bacterium]|nr:CNP1-like family protein [Gammaproteobacteria bacterium]